METLARNLEPILAHAKRKNDDPSRVAGLWKECSEADIQVDPFKSASCAPWCSTSFVGEERPEFPVRFCRGFPSASVMSPGAKWKRLNGYVQGRWLTFRQPPPVPASSNAQEGHARAGSLCERSCMTCETSGIVAHVVPCLTSESPWMALSMFEEQAPTLMQIMHLAATPWDAWRNFGDTRLGSPHAFSGSDPLPVLHRERRRVERPR